VKRAHALLAVDVVVFALVDGELRTRLVKIRDGPFAGGWAFPGGLVGADESLEAVALRELNVAPEVDVHLEQLRTFGDPERDPRGRVVATAYLGLVPDPAVVGESNRYEASCWADARNPPRLAYDHEAMAAAALERLRGKLGYTSIVRTLLPVEFTLSELQSAYEVILGRRLDRRNFRKKVAATGLLAELGRRRRGPHRPAALYRFREPRLITVDIL
jgi:8-oxo-dGTP diphosphatase